MYSSSKGPDQVRQSEELTCVAQAPGCANSVLAREGRSLEVMLTLTARCRASRSENVCTRAPGVHAGRLLLSQRKYERNPPRIARQMAEVLGAGAATGSAAEAMRTSKSREMKAVQRCCALRKAG